ncbi:MAG: hypothetical protein EA377_00220 [Phycisphaerales bacterium]|nr:MAG: hypothetical protein EA377_00220 [Phycisphaerales bacterium]
MAAGLITLPACTTVQPLAAKVDSAALEASDERRAARQQRAAVPLEERIAMIEADLERTMVPIRFVIGDETVEEGGVLVPRFLNEDGRPGPLLIESNTAVLSALAARYAATGDPWAKEMGERLIRGILAMDARSGELDGFVPFYLHPRTLAPSEHHTHANVYTQLLFAYALAHEAFGPNEDIERHVSLIYQRYVEDNFQLRQRDGSRTPRNNLRVILFTVNARQALGRRLLDRAALTLGDEQTQELAEREQWGGPLLGPLHFRFFNIELPTTSSSWLSLQGMTALTLLGDSYESRIKSLARKYERDDNPFFRAIAAMHGADEDLAAIRRRLEEFPYPATNQGVINTHRTDVEITTGDFVKFNASPESREPLPLYEIASDTYLWKGRLRKVDARLRDRPQTVLGHDLLQAYWLLRWLESREDR